jgi:hypothetical protein
VVEAVAAISFVGMKEQNRKEGRKEEEKGQFPLLCCASPLFHSRRECSSSLDLNGKKEKTREGRRKSDESKLRRRIIIIKSNEKRVLILFSFFSSAITCS